MADPENNKVQLASNLTVAWLSNPNTRATSDEATAFLQSIHTTLARLAPGEGDGTIAAPAPETAVTGEHEPAVTVRKSLASKDKIISMIDGKPYSTLKRHLAKHGLTPAQYRERYGLKADYPMTAPSYSEKRSAMAKKIGLGAMAAARRKASATPKAASNAARAKPGRGRKPKAQAS